MDPFPFTATFRPNRGDWEREQWAYVRRVASGYAWMLIVPSSLLALIASGVVMSFTMSYLRQVQHIDVALGWTGALAVSGISVAALVAVDWFLGLTLRARFQAASFADSWKDVTEITVAFDDGQVRWSSQGVSVAADDAALRGLNITASGLTFGVKSVAVFVPVAAFGGDAMMRRIGQAMLSRMSPEARARSGGVVN